MLGSIRRLLIRLAMLSVSFPAPALRFERAMHAWRRLYQSAGMQKLRKSRSNLLYRQHLLQRYRMSELGARLLQMLYLDLWGRWSGEWLVLEVLDVTALTDGTGAKIPVPST
jgi:hypothetical protein